MMKNYNKIFTVIMWLLIAISVVVLVCGFVIGFEANDGQLTDVMFYWTYIILGIALCAVVIFGAWIAFKNSPKNLLKAILLLIGAAVVCGIVYLVAPGKPAMGMLEQPSASTLKLTDTVLDLSYLLGGVAILAILVGEIYSSVRNKK